MMNEKQIEKLMKSLSVSREEAIEIIKEDEEIDGMTVKEAQADLSAEQKKAVKKACSTGEKSKEKKAPVKRERKPNEGKRWIMTQVKTLFEGIALNGKVSDVVLSNEERTLDFVKDGVSYTLTLTAHRKK